VYLKWQVTTEAADKREIAAGATAATAVAIAETVTSTAASKGGKAANSTGATADTHTLAVARKVGLIICVIGSYLDYLPIVCSK